MTTFTASEVRDWERAYKGTGAAKVFSAFADMLEADERARPVAFRYQAQQVATGARKFPGETRHETALRYIREAECQEAALADQENPNG